MHYACLMKPYFQRRARNCSGLRFIIFMQEVLDWGSKSKGTAKKIQFQFTRKKDD
jgi:hypothetical protein